MLKTLGWFNLASPIPIFILTAFWCIVVMACFGFPGEPPAVAVAISALPLLIHPVSSIAGLVFALRRWTVSKKGAIMCMMLSAAGIVENILFCWFMAVLSTVD